MSRLWSCESTLDRGVFGMADTLAAYSRECTAQEEEGWDYAFDRHR